MFGEVPPEVDLFCEVSLTRQCLELCRDTLNISDNMFSLNMTLLKRESQKVLVESGKFKMSHQSKLLEGRRSFNCRYHQKQGKSGEMSGNLPRTQEVPGEN